MSPVRTATATTPCATAISGARGTAGTTNPPSAKVVGDPTVPAFKDDIWIFSTGEDGNLYLNAYDGEAWSGWKTVNHDYSFKYGPATNVYLDTCFLYGVADNDYVYYKETKGDGWTEWQNVSGESTTKWDPCAVGYGDYENVFWTGDDGNVYYATHDGQDEKWQDLGDNYDHDPYSFEYGDVYYKPYKAEEDGGS